METAFQPRSISNFYESVGVRYVAHVDQATRKPRNNGPRYFVLLARGDNDNCFFRERIRRQYTSPNWSRSEINETNRRVHDRRFDATDTFLR
jgi:hypothetical protein